MSIISSQNVITIIRKTLSILNPNIMAHGEIVGYILYKMLEYGQDYSEQEILEYTMLGMMHDIGLYRVDGLDNVADFELKNTWSHSIYGFLFLKYLSPMGDRAEIVLYHHLDYERYGLVKMKYEHVTACLALADKMDSFMRRDKTEMETDYFTRYRDIKVSGKALDIFLEAEKKFGITAKLVSGEYKEELGALLSRSQWSEGYKKSFLEMLVYTIDFRSEYTVLHTMATVNFAVQLGKLMGVGAREQKRMYYGALLHDLGKIAIPLDILESPGKLSDEEMRIMKAHVRITEIILSGLVEPDVLEIAIRHHEKLDGSGYHKGLTEKELTLPQKIVAVADMLSALYGQRSYKPSFESGKIEKILNKDADNYKISKPVVDCLMKNYDNIINNFEEQKGETIGLYLKIKEQYEEIWKKFEGIMQ
ncbi:MAG: HD domain-containing protein [Clostridiales bacterium]|nr:HD domain-containing protein [Clostridiales bacterium]